MEVRRSGDAPAVTGSQDPAPLQSASIPHDLSQQIPAASFSVPTAQLAPILLEEARLLRSTGRSSEALHVASRAAASAGGDPELYCRSIVEVAAAWAGLGDDRSALLTLETGWQRAERFLDRDVGTTAPLRELLETLAAAYGRAGEARKAERCFENAELYFQSRTGVRSESCVEAGMRQLLAGAVDDAGGCFAEVLSESARGVSVPLRAMAIAEVGRGIVLWLQGYEDGLHHIASGMSRSRLIPAIERECRTFAFEAAEALAMCDDPRREVLLSDVRHAVG